MNSPAQTHLPASHPELSSNMHPWTTHGYLNEPAALAGKHGTCIHFFINRKYDVMFENSLILDAFDLSIIFYAPHF